MNAIKQKVIVQNGVIAFPAGGLPDNSEVEVVVTPLENLQDVEDDDDGEMEGLVRLYLEAKAEWEVEGRSTIPLQQVIAEIEAQRSAASRATPARRSAKRTPQVAKRTQPKA